MAAAAVAQLQKHCSMEIVTEKLNSFFQSRELQAKMTAGHLEHSRSQLQPDWTPSGYHDALLSGWFNKETREVCQGFAIEEDDVVLDIGCGKEAVTLFCAELGTELIFTGNDKPTMESLVEKIRQSTPMSFRALLSDDNPIPLQSGSASRIIMLDVLHRHGDPLSLLKEAVRVGRPGARYLLSVPTAEGEELLSSALPTSQLDAQNHRHVFQAADFEHIVVQAGLVVECRQTLGFYWTLWSCFAQAVGLPGDEQNKWPHLEERPVFGHPLLKAWAGTWQALMDVPEGDRTRLALEQALPKTQVLIAVKGGR